MPSSLRDSLSEKQLRLFDEAHVASYNRRRKSDKYRLHSELGPSAFDGDIDAASVILLLANPGFDHTSSLDDHQFRREGWPLGGLHPDAPSGIRAWWLPRLRELITAYGEQAVSQRVACLQLTPWASTKFDSTLRLPSRRVILEAASRCATRGAVMVVMRAEKLWLEAEALRTTRLRFKVNSNLTSYLSPGNLPPDAWQNVFEAVRDA